MVVPRIPSGIPKVDQFMKEVAEAFKKLISVKVNSSAIGTKTTLNFIAGSGINITAVDNPNTGAIDITVELT